MDSKTNDKTNENQPQLKPIDNIGQSEQRLAAQEKEIASFLKYNANGIITITDTLEIKRYNRRFMEMFNISPRTTPTGHLITDLIEKGEPLDEILELINKVGKPPLFETAPIIINNPDGTKIFLEATASRINTGTDKGLILTFTDVTKLRNMDSAILSASVAAEERERTRLAQELHDGIGATLSSVNIYINMILSGNSEVDEIFKTLRLTKDLVAQTIDSVKAIANNLHPVILTRFGLVATITNIIEGMQESRLTKFRFNHDQYDDIEDKDLELTLYRIINELIINTLKYANAKDATITLQRTNNQVILQYSDNGIGFDPPDARQNPRGTGMGTSNIIGRVKGYNGICNIESSPGNGMSVLIEIPYPTHSQQQQQTTQ